ncbi:MAG: hypothetical protein NC098_06215 [Lachnoclostridium sp.]|nr:hypothetical protein [Lachnoclostridium sp.]
MSEEEKNNVEAPVKEAKKKPGILRKLVKWLLIAVVTIVVIIIAVISLTVWILTPPRLTPIIENIANENLNAEVSIDKVELTFWHTFPRFQVDVNGLRVKSHSLDALPDSIMPAVPLWADSLASVSKLSGGINLLELFRGRIELYDISVVNPAFNIVQVTDEYANYDIVPPSEEASDENTPLILPDISMGKFEILGDMPIRYTSIPDSLDVTLTLSMARLAGEHSPRYRLDVKGNTGLSAGDIVIDNLGLGLGGDIVWNLKSPETLGLEDFLTSLGPIELTTSANIDFAGDLTVNSLNMRLKEVRLDEIIAMIPADMRGELDKVTTDVALSADIQLTAPFAPAVDSIPSAKVGLKLKEGSLRYDRLNLRKVALNAEATVDGKNLNKSVLTVSDLTVIGQGTGFKVTAKVTDPLSDPHAKGTFKGGIYSDWLPKRLLTRLPFDITGRLKADCTFDVRQSYLTPANFHYMKFDGEADLSDFSINMHDGSMAVDVTEAQLKLGTNSTIKVGDFRADSLLTASINIDSVNFFIPGLTVNGRKWHMGVGMMNRASTADTSMINPIGGTISADMIRMVNTIDSMSVRLRKSTIRGSLTRFRGSTRKPRLAMKIATDGGLYINNYVKAFLTDASMDVTVYPAPPRIGRRMKARMDSIHTADPSLKPEQVYAKALSMRDTTRRRSRDYEYGGEAILDDSTAQILKQWKASGHLKVARAAMFTPYFPIRNSIRNLDMEFSTDSLIVKDMRYRMGHSEFSLNGKVTNISRSLTSRSGSPIMIDFALTGDTIDVNRIAEAVFAGASYADGKSATGGSTLLSASDSETEMQSMIDSVAQVDTMSPLILPMNVEAELKLRFNDVLYSDLVMKDLRGSVMVSGGAINFHNLSARTDIGSVGFNALYSAPDESDMRFAFGMQLKDFRIARFMKMIPAIDTLMPLLNDISGIINAEIAATSQLTPQMDIDIPSLTAAIKISGDSLVLLDNETFRTVSKWLMFKNKQRNMIDKMSVEMIVENSRMELFPFVFDMDRYRLGVMGNNDLAMNFNYHVAVIKSPLPFKFGINLSGNPDKMKIRLGGAKLNEKTAVQSVQIADTTRINLVRQIESAFRRGVKNSGVSSLRFNRRPDKNALNASASDTISATDSLTFIREGLIEAPAPAPEPAAAADKKKKKKK